MRRKPRRDSTDVEEKEVELNDVLGIVSYYFKLLPQTAEPKPGHIISWQKHTRYFTIFFIPDTQIKCSRWQKHP